MLISPLVNFVGELKWVVLPGGQKTISSFVLRHNQPQRQFYLLSYYFLALLIKCLLSVFVLLEVFIKK
jgi:hypothetical protein